MRRHIVLSLFLTIIFLVQSVSVNAQDNFGEGRIPAFNTAKRIVAVATAEVGYKEGVKNYSKYGLWNGQNNKPWCGSFVSWCAHQAGVPTTSIKRYSNNCMAEFNWFKTQKRWKNSNYKPHAGDVIFLNTQYKYEHTGLVIKYQNGIVYTIEGNSGDMVKEKQYAVNDQRIIGYGIPEYDDAKTYANNLLISKQEVTLDTVSVTINVGEKKVLVESISPELSVNTRVWTSANPKICTVNSEGEIVGKSTGTTTVSIGITNGNTAECIVKVKKAD